MVDRDLQYPIGALGIMRLGFLEAVGFTPIAKHSLSSIYIVSHSMIRYANNPNQTPNDAK